MSCAGRRMLARAVIGLVLAILAVQSACRGEGSERRRLVVFAAASLRDVFKEIAGDFERARQDVQVVFQFAGSQELRAQLEQGAPADVVVTADRLHMQALREAGLVEASVIVAGNALVLVTTPRSLIATLVDLPRAERIVTGAREVPIGRYTEEVLKRVEAEHPGFRAQVEARIVSRELNVKQVLARIVMGEADAGIVYATDVAAPDTRVRVVPIPERFAPQVVLPAAALRAAPEPELAAAFIAFLQSPAARARFETAGFRSPPAAP